jgi:hypothetical protein
LDIVVDAPFSALGVPPEIRIVLAKPTCLVTFCGKRIPGVTFPAYKMYRYSPLWMVDHAICSLHSLTLPLAALLSFLLKKFSVFLRLEPEDPFGPSCRLVLPHILLLVPLVPVLAPS